METPRSHAQDDDQLKKNTKKNHPGSMMYPLPGYPRALTAFSSSHSWLWDPVLGQGMDVPSQP